MFHIIGAMSEFERDVISERTQAGLDAARARGRLKAIEKIEPRNLARAKELYAARKGDHYVRCHGPQSKNVSSVICHDNRAVCQGTCHEALRFQRMVSTSLGVTLL